MERTRVDESVRVWNELGLWIELGFEGTSQGLMD